MLDIDGNSTGLSTRGDEVVLGLDLCSGRKRTISMMSTMCQGIEKMQVAGYQMSPVPETPHKMPNCNLTRSTSRNCYLASVSVGTIDAS